MQQKILWGERAPGMQYPFPISALSTLPNDEYTYEIVEGELIRMAGSGIDASEIAARLIYYLMGFVLPRGLGRITSSDGTYDLTRPGDPTDTALVPDVAFVQAGRLPARNPGYGKVSPDLVAEVASPSQSRPEMNTKAQFYLDRGVRLVWVLWPNRQEV
ncbi:MAG TPA: Uma2 family endonuclease, partial [Ktedonobacterales bacterium]|nr:Uma2 family endonuclease [Ktedonobacterales bacterium]